MPTITTHDDVSEQISREIEYQQKKGRRVIQIRMSPECEERLRLLHRGPAGARLIEHDGIPVSVDRRLIGLKQWVIVTDAGIQVKESQIDRVRQSI